MPDELQKRRDLIVEHLLDHVAFDGWTEKSLTEAARDAGFEPDVALRAFPDGMPQVVDHFADWSDRRMAERLSDMDLDGMKIRDRIHTCVKTRVELNAGHKEALRRLIAYLALPSNAPLAARLAWRTCSLMWYLSGDRSADWNHYTKRGLLVSVYSSTLLYWLADPGDDKGDYPDTWAFLERRISDVLRIFGLPRRLKERMNCLPGVVPLQRAGSKSSR